MVPRMNVVAPYPSADEPTISGKARGSAAQYASDGASSPVSTQDLAPVSHSHATKISKSRSRADFFFDG